MLVSWVTKSPAAAEFSYWEWVSEEILGRIWGYLKPSKYIRVVVFACSDVCWGDATAVRLEVAPMRRSAWCPHAGGHGLRLYQYSPKASSVHRDLFDVHNIRLTIIEEGKVRLVLRRPAHPPAWV